MEAFKEKEFNLNQMSDDKKQLRADAKAEGKKKAKAIKAILAVA